MTKKKPEQNKGGGDNNPFDPRREECWRFYLDKESNSYGNAFLSAIKSGYGKGYSKQITTQQWWLARVRRLGLLDKAEKVLDEDLEMDTVVPIIGMFGPIVDKKTNKALTKIDPDLRRIRQSSATFISSRLGKKHYSTRTELTGADGEKLPTPIYAAQSTGGKKV